MIFAHMYQGEIEYTLKGTKEELLDDLTLLTNSVIHDIADKYQRPEPEVKDHFIIKYLKKN